MHASSLPPLATGLLAGLLAASALAAADWPRFRGPNGSGIGTGTLPLEFGPETNRWWSTPVPSGHSSPSIHSNRLYLTGYDGNRLLTLAYDPATGKELWRRELPPGRIERGATQGNPATATPATDGTRVIVYFGAFGLAAYDRDGQELWRHPLPVPLTQHGAGTSPVLAGDLVLLNVDQDVGSYLLAVDARTGATVWRAARPEFHRGFSTPVLFPAGRPEYAVLTGTLRLAAYDLATGRERWTVRGFPNEMVASAVAGEDRIFAAGWTAGSGVSRMPPFENLLAEAGLTAEQPLPRAQVPNGPARRHFGYLDSDQDGSLTRAEYEAGARLFDDSRNIAVAVRADGHGDVTDSHVAWQFTRGLPYAPTPLLYEGRLYLVRNGGLVTCLDARSGKALYQEERLGAFGDYYASPIAGGGRVCFVSEPGTAVVIRAGDFLEVQARQALGSPVLATPALVDGTLYVRTQRELLAFREPATPPPVVPASAVPADNATLAREILADPDLPAVLQMARELLRSGLTAGSGYGEVWIRDLNTFIELALTATDPPPIREALLNFLRFQGPRGDIVDGYIPAARTNIAYRYRQSSLAPGLRAHKNTVETDQEASLVLAVGKYVRRTADEAFLREEIQGQTVRQRLARALSYVLTERFDPTHGLVWGATTADWGDVQPEHPWGVELDASSHRAIDIYDNALFLAAMEEFRQLPGTEAADAEQWRAGAGRLRAQIQRHLWDPGRRQFIPHLYLQGSPFPATFDEAAVYYHGGTAVAIEAGVLDRAAVLEALERMRANQRAAGATSIGLTLYPPYPAGTFANPAMAPYGYQNGGDWCWFGGRMVQQLIRFGYIHEAYRELRPMVKRVREHGDFREWWSREGEPRGSRQYRGSAGVLGLAIEQLLAWARQPHPPANPPFTPAPDSPKLPSP